MPYKAPPPPTKAVWLDCDPGHDDAMAIILAGGRLINLYPDGSSFGKTELLIRVHCPTGYAPEIRLLGISTVAGNQTVEKVTLNALNLLAAAGLGHIGE
jgi:purine nucleosidase